MFPTIARYELPFQIGAAACLGLAVCSTLFAYAYSADTAAFLATPGQLWAFVCGNPIQSTATVPILAGIGAVFGVVGVALLALRRRALTS